MTSPLMLSFDIGTQSVRALLINTKGDIVDYEQIKYEQAYISDEPGWAEQEADFYYELCCKASKIMLSRNENKLANIKAVVMATIRDSVVCLDKNYKPLRRTILWLDKREALNTTPIALSKRIIFRCVNMHDVADMQKRQSVCNWIMQNQPKLWDNTEKYVMLPTYLNYKFTGKLIDSVANIIGHMPIDYKNKVWLGEKGLNRCLFDIPTEKLCDLCDPGEIIGHINEQTCIDSGIPKATPLIATGSDKGCETLGLSVIKPHQASISLGTTAVVQMTTDKYFEPLAFVPSYPAVIKNYYNPEIQIYRGYWMLSWFKTEFAYEETQKAKELGICVEKLLDSYLSSIPAGCNGLLLHPFWGAGVANPNAKGSIIGFSDVHTKMHMYRAIIEGIGFALLNGMRTLEKRSNRKVTEIFVGGGGSQSDEICQITANIFGLPVKRIHTHEACAIGAAMIGFVATGNFEDIEKAVQGMTKIGSVFLPEKHEQEIYYNIFNHFYKDIDKDLASIYKKIKKFTRRYNNETV